VTNAAGAPFVGAKVVIETSSDGAAWKQAATALSGQSGAYSSSIAPPAREGVRVRFTAPSTFRPARSSVATVAPQPALSAPAMPATVAANHRFTMRGTLTPRHAAGAGTVTVVVQRRVGATWTDYRTLAATCTGSGSVSSYSASVSLPAASYRMRAGVASDSLHAATTSSWSTMVVR
jgi:hypothetical protein